jgi:5-hydroxyisourate hydrolase-like protein (transthyretin family)
VDLVSDWKILEAIMEFNKTFTGNFANVDVSEDEAKAAMENFTAQASRSSAPALNVFAQLQQKRAQRLEAAASSLEKVLGAKHPQVAVLKQNSASAGEFKTQFNIQAERVEKRPKLRANEWMVYGRVFDSAGKPAAGLTVRVFDQDRKFDDLLGETETDETGDFFTVYHARDFIEKGENAPELYIRVEDAAGNKLFSSRENVRPQAGQSEYFVIQLGKATTKAEAKKRGRPPKVVAAKTASGKTTKTVKTASTLRKKKK